MTITYTDIQNANNGIKTTDVKGKEYAEVNQRGITPACAGKRQY